jgi:hypothetical protein
VICMLKKICRNVELVPVLGLVAQMYTRA